MIPEKIRRPIQISQRAIENRTSINAPVNAPVNAVGNAEKGGKDRTYGVETGENRLYGEVVIGERKGQAGAGN